MTTTQYIGSRYVPLFAEPLDWDNTKEYEALTIVYYAGNSYTSRQSVPKGIDITDEKYWALTGNYNAQIEQYRKEVAKYDSRITSADGTANDALSLAQTNKQGIATLDEQMAGTQDSVLKKSIATINAHNLLVIGDSYTQLSASNWAELFATANNMTLYKHATSSMPFNHTEDWQTTETFIDKLVADDYISKNPSELEYLICYGGINDKVDTDAKKTGFKAAVKKFCEQAKATYPKAKVFIVGPQRATTTERTELNTKVKLMREACLEANTCYINAANWQFWWPETWGSYYLSDGIHPSADGYKMIASTMSDCVFGDGFKPCMTNLGVKPMDDSSGAATDIKYSCNGKRFTVFYRQTFSGKEGNFIAPGTSGNPDVRGGLYLFGINVYKNVSNYPGALIGGVRGLHSFPKAIAYTTFESDNHFVEMFVEPDFITGDDGE